MDSLQPLGRFIFSLWCVVWRSGGKLEFSKPITYAAKSPYLYKQVVLFSTYDYYLNSELSLDRSKCEV